ncbi:MAG: DUF2254 domain-containing protein [Pirellulaceae bacterium]
MGKIRNQPTGRFTETGIGPLKTYLISLWDTLRSGYWFIPACVCLATATLAIIIPIFELQFTDSGSLIAPAWLRTTHESAVTMLSSIFGAMITVIGTVFSITIVALSLTSQQFGPRLLRQFMSDRTTQWTLGFFIATATYCLLLLRVLDKNRTADQLPHLSVAVGVGLAIISIAVLIHFIHHVAVHIQAPSVVAAVASELDASIERLFPVRVGCTDENQSLGVTDDLGNPSATILSRHEGYIQAIDAEGLLSFCCENQFIVKLLCRPGDFISEGTALLGIWCAGAEARQWLESDAAQHDSQTTARDVAEHQVNDLFIVGRIRTPRQDARCAVDELVEVAVRSLSPGINDPFTACNCIDRLSAALAKLSEREMPSPYRYDSDNRLRVIAPAVRFQELLDAAFDPIRRNGADCVQVLIRLMVMLEKLDVRAAREEDREAIGRHAGLVAQCGERLTSDYDVSCIADAYERFQARPSSSISSQ